MYMLIQVPYGCRCDVQNNTLSGKATAVGHLTCLFVNQYTQPITSSTALSFFNSYAVHFSLLSKRM